MRENFPEHYYYSPQQYHLTVVPVPGFAKPEQAVERLAPVLRDWRLPVSVFGFAVNCYQASPVLYPEEETLVPMRAKLRAAAGITGQAYTDHNNVWEELLWVNFVRFTVTPQEELIKRLQSRAADNLGHFVLGRFELYETSTKTLDPESSKLLHTFVS